jgi:hypothetical protein
LGSAPGEKRNFGPASTRSWKENSTGFSAPEKEREAAVPKPCQGRSRKKAVEKTRKDLAEDAMDLEFPKAENAAD